MRLIAPSHEPEFAAVAAEAGVMVDRLPPKGAEDDGWRAGKPER
jgi:hypothetical protein